jgi:hypothetical protein
VCGREETKTRGWVTGERGAVRLSPWRCRTSLVGSSRRRRRDVDVRGGIQRRGRGPQDLPQRLPRPYAPTASSLTPGSTLWGGHDQERLTELCISLLLSPQGYLRICWSRTKTRKTRAHGRYARMRAELALLTACTICSNSHANDILNLDYTTPSDPNYLSWIQWRFSATFCRNLQQVIWIGASTSAPKCNPF